MGTNARKRKPSRRPVFKVGDRVRVRFGLYTPLGTIVEDRGFLGSRGRRLFRVRFEFDPPNVMFTEAPEDELAAVP